MAHQWNEIAAEMLEVAPELTHSFESLRYEWRSESSVYWRDITETDLKRFLALEGEQRPYFYDPHSEEESDEPGHYIYFEDILRPYISQLAQLPVNASRLQPIMQWVEKLANSDDAFVSNLVYIALCESFLGYEEHETNINNIFPFMGKTTRQMCVELMLRFHVSAETKKLFGVK